MRRAQQVELAGPYAAVQLSPEELSAKAAAGKELRKMLVGLYLSENMSARKLCHSAWYHQKSGGVGMSDLAKDPASTGDMTHSGHFNEWVKHILAREHGDASFKFVKAPMHDKKGACRTEVSIPVAMPSESMSQHFFGHTNAIDASELRTPKPMVLPYAPWTQAHLEHSVVVQLLANGVHISRIRRIGIFLDDAGFTKNESFGALYLSDVGANERFLIAIVRKEELCQCGCKGFCTYWCIHDAVRHDLDSAADGRWVMSHSDGEPFLPESAESARAGRPMPLAMAATELRADMPGYTGPVGMRSSSHGLFPCPCCNTRKAELGNFNNVSLDETDWNIFDDTQFWAEVNVCSVVVRIANQEDVRRILAVPLEFDHRPAHKSGSLGRRVCADVALTTPGIVCKRVIAYIHHAS